MKKLASIEKLENWIDSYLNFEKTPKKNIFWLDTMRFFCEKFGHPENFAPCFHVAGSKGKGSVSTFIASILDEAGYKTGLYTSPHILDFIERVSSPNGPFEEEAYDRAVQEIMEGVQAISQEELPGQRPITWFELVTLFSFLVFRQAKVEYSVFEVGLGGRLDSTNIVNPKVSVITPIELEHTEFLGDTLEKIAFEKGGIIKENTPVVIARQRPEVRKVFEKIAEEKHARAIFVEDAIQNLNFKIKNISDCIKNNTFLTNGNSGFHKNCIKNHTSLENQNILPLMSVSFSSKIFSRPVKTTLQLLGKFQAENAALAAIAVKTVLPTISEEVIERGIAKAKLPARFEIIQKPKGFENIPFLVMDGAHTVNSVRFTMETMNQVFAPISHRILLFACAADKDATDIAPLFKNQFESVFLTKPGNVKQSDLETLAEAFSDAEIPYDLNEDFEAQIKKAFDHANANKSILLVTGSFYLIAEVKKCLNNMKG
ncbi:MAG: bifunctional folylpolyglutamate synthase/dihydrofolate synthase [Treponema sp.]|nr:bifunctional folylpolyglutamate synthase/dihydrofolate synthase [Treponema sp.]